MKKLILTLISDAALSNRGRLQGDFIAIKGGAGLTFTIMPVVMPRHAPTATVVPFDPIKARML